MGFNNKEIVADKFLNGVEKFRDNKELLDFLEAYFLFRMQEDSMRKLNKEDLSFTMNRLYGIIELRELLISDTKVEEVTEEPDMEFKNKQTSVNSLMDRVKQMF